MRHVSKIFLAAMAALLMGAVSSYAADDDARKAKKEREDHPKLAEFEATGETKLCLNRNFIRNTRVLDDYTILFEMRGKKFFVNRLPYKCFGLGFNKGFGYSLSTSLLCNVDIITVVGSTSTGASCGLGKFHELIPIQRPDEDDENDDEPVEG